jgi:hypothetical protein
MSNFGLEESDFAPEVIQEIERLPASLEAPEPLEPEPEAEPEAKPAPVVEALPPAETKPKPMPKPKPAPKPKATATVPPWTQPEPSTAAPAGSKILSAFSNAQGPGSKGTGRGLAQALEVSESGLGSSRAFGAALGKTLDRYMEAFMLGGSCEEARQLHLNTQNAYPVSSEKEEWVGKWKRRLEKGSCL